MQPSTRVMQDLSGVHKWWKRRSDGTARKRISLAGRMFVVQGDSKDRYFRTFVRHGESFEDAPIAVARRHCGCDAVLIDVGANIGLSAMAFAHIAANGRVLAIEPSPRNFALLKSNVELNRLTNIDLVHAAASDAPGVLRLAEDPEFMAGSRIETTTGTGGNGIEVTATTLDAEVRARGLDRLDLLKIDVEGHERQVLEGASRTLATFRPICVVEFNSYMLVYHQGVAPLEFLRFVAQLFPKLYYFDKATSKLCDLNGREDEFLRSNEEGGFVDDLVGAFSELPASRT